MAGPAQSTVVPQCLACTRRWLEMAQRSFQHQSRRAHKQAILPGQPPNTIPIVLTQPVDGYGPKGKYLAVAGGVMRNSLYPARKARYLRKDEIPALIEQRVSLTREYGFDTIKAAEALENLRSASAATTPTTPAAKPLSDEETMPLIEALLPPELVFHRNPIQGSFDGVRTKIFGSVSPGNILAAINLVLQTDKRGAGVTLHAHNIEFEDYIAIENNRIQHLGEYMITITKGKNLHEVTRRVVVRGQLDVSDTPATDQSVSADPASGDGISVREAIVETSKPSNSADKSVQTDINVETSNVRADRLGPEGK